MKHGYRSLNVDHLAKELGISKKTIYELFPGKKAIIASVLNQRDKLLLELADKMHAASNNAVENYTIMIYGIDKIVGFHQQLCNLYELEKYYNDLFHENVLQLNDVVYRLIKDIIDRGISEDLFGDFDVENTSQLFAAQYLLLIVPGFFTSDYRQNPELHRNMVFLHLQLFLRSLVSEKGMKILIEIDEKKIEEFFKSTNIAK